MEFIFLKKLIQGILIGSSLAIILDFKKNLIYSESLIKKIINLRLIDKLSKNKIDLWESDIKLLYNGLIKNNNFESLSIITLGNIDNKYLDNININLQKLFKNNKFLITDDIEKAENYNAVLLLIGKGCISKSKLIKMRNTISFYDLNLIGWLLIE